MFFYSFCLNAETQDTLNILGLQEQYRHDFWDREDFKNRLPA